MRNYLSIRIGVSTEKSSSEANGAILVPLAAALERCVLANRTAVSLRGGHARLTRVEIFLIWILAL